MDSIDYYHDQSTKNISKFTFVLPKSRHRFVISPSDCDLCFFPHPSAYQPRNIIQISSSMKVDEILPSLMNIARATSIKIVEMVEPLASWLSLYYNYDPESSSTVPQWTQKISNRLNRYFIESFRLCEDFLLIISSFIDKIPKESQKTKEFMQLFDMIFNEILEKSILRVVYLLPTPFKCSIR